MRDDPRITLHHLSPRDQRLLHAATEWARCAIASNTDRVISKAQIFCYEKADIDGIHEKALAFHLGGSIGLGPKPTQELLDVKDKDSLENILRYGEPADKIYPHGEVIGMIGTLVHEYAHMLFDRTLRRVVHRELHRQAKHIDAYGPEMRSINEAFSYSMQKKLTGLATLSQAMANGYGDEANVQLLITYYRMINEYAKEQSVDDALLAVIKEHGIQPTNHLTLPQSRHMIIYNLTTRKRHAL